MNVVTSLLGLVIVSHLSPKGSGHFSLGLGGRRKHTLQDNPILQARILTFEGSSSTLGVDNTFGEVRPSL